MAFLAQGYDFSAIIESVACGIVCIGKFLTQLLSHGLYWDPFLNMKLNWYFNTSYLFLWIYGTKMSGIDLI